MTDLRLIFAWLRYRWHNRHARLDAWQKLQADIEARRNSLEVRDYASAAAKLGWSRRKAVV